MIQKHKRTKSFFQGCEPHITHMRNEPVLKVEDFRSFHSEAWKLGRRMRDDMPGLHSIMVLRLQVRGGAKLVAKTFFGREYFESKKQLDPFLDEARAYEHITRHCAPSKLSYFPRYMGTILNLTRREYPTSYPLRPQAIVLERVHPNIQSRRILGERQRPKHALFDDFGTKISEMPLSPFEQDWYISLTIDRLQSVAALHDMGIIHRDISDEHFRLPHDFHDTVLYDFSHSYIINIPWPYIRRPVPFAELIQKEQHDVLGSVFSRAQTADFRTYMATSLDLDPAMIMNACSQDLEDTEKLELIALQTRHRPDAFTHPSLASIFPFLESIRPNHTPTWHIARARLLQVYDSVWFVHVPNSEQVHLVSFSGAQNPELDVDNTAQEVSFLLLLVPRSWDMQSHKRRLCTCAQLVANKECGSIILKEEFDELDG
ncbi:hypothetical protein BDV25DRAFT_171823 [Aspergillus avenaceus]|uniref:Protein kinase domain-containing protein n=1 Tax=Aspergillus avenaceus TaxID=36643 RepID=A0A5N6U8B0_ASPAV|nr:hypothetical protein BDV25DRAFT_171823 [Aspergillus avenaceus]